MWRPLGNGRLKHNGTQNTDRRTSLRIQREAELLGSSLQSYHTRENVVVGAKFLRDDLPYFAELLGEVATMTKYRREYSGICWDSGGRG